MLHWLIDIFGIRPFDVVVNTLLIGGIVYFVCSWLFYPIYEIFSGLWVYWELRRHTIRFLEVIPPVHTDASPLAVQKLCDILHSIVGPTHALSFEVVASCHEGIRYLIGVQENDLEIVQRHVASYMHELQFRVLEAGYKPERFVASNHCKVFELMQMRHYAFPLQNHDSYAVHDPMDYIIGSMAKLQQHELISMQTVLTAKQSVWPTRLYDKLLKRGSATVEGGLRNFILSNWWVWAVGLMYGGLTNNLKAGASLMLIVLAILFFIPKKKTS